MMDVLEKETKMDINLKLSIQTGLAALCSAGTSGSLSKLCLDSYNLAKTAETAEEIAKYNSLTVLSGFAVILFIGYTSLFAYESYQQFKDYLKKESS